MNENETPEEIEVEATFHIDNEKAAEWLLRKLNECDAATERAAKWAAEIKEDNDKRKASLLKRFGVELEAFAADQLKDAKKKSFKLPSGTLGFRSTTPKLVVTDENEYSKWVERHLPEAARYDLEADVTPLTLVGREKLKMALDELGVLVSVETRIVKTVVNDHFKNSGVVPAGCDWVPAEEKFYVK